MSVPVDEQPRRPSFRGAFYLLSVALIITAGLVVPLPLVETVPGTPTRIEPLVQVEGYETTELTGSTSLLTVRQQEQPILQSLAALLDGQRSLRLLEEVYPPGIDRDDYLAGQRERFGRQFEIAAAVGAEAAGVEVELITAVVVVNVVPAGPADGLLARGDVITAVDGEPLGDAEELQSITSQGEVGQELTLTVIHAGEQRDVLAELGSLPGEDGARLGVVIENGIDELRLPFDITLGQTRIGGPSAGLMVGLTVYDLLAEEDLLRGREVLGTGTLGSDGTVGPVGGVPEKIRAAADHGADLVLVPNADLQDALDAAPDDLVVVGVSSFEEALEVLRREPA